MKKNKLIFLKGQSLFEVVVALAISSLIIFALVALTSSAIRNTNFSKNKTLAGRYAQEATEWLRGQRDSDIAAFKVNTLTSIWCLDSLDFSNVGNCSAEEYIPGTIFLREVNFSTSVENGKNLVEAAIVVSWESSAGVHEVRSVTSLSDWRER